MKRLSWGAKIGVMLSALLLGLFGLGTFYTFSSVSAPIPASAPLPQPNGYDFYVAAARALRPANPPVDAIGDKTSPSPAEAARNYAPAPPKVDCRQRQKLESAVTRAQNARA